MQTGLDWLKRDREGVEERNRRRERGRHRDREHETGEWVSGKSLKEGIDMIKMHCRKLSKN